MKHHCLDVHWTIGNIPYTSQNHLMVKIAAPKLYMDDKGVSVLLLSECIHRINLQKKIILLFIIPFSMYICTSSASCNVFPGMWHKRVRMSSITFSIRTEGHQMVFLSKHYQFLSSDGQSICWKVLLSICISRNWFINSSAQIGMPPK